MKGHKMRAPITEILFYEIATYLSFPDLLRYRTLSINHWILGQSNEYMEFLIYRRDEIYEKLIEAVYRYLPGKIPSIQYMIGGLKYSFLLTDRNMIDLECDNRDLTRCYRTMLTHEQFKTFISEYIKEHFNIISSLSYPEFLINPVRYLHEHHPETIVRSAYLPYLIINFNALTTIHLSK